jgi:hypothetical protein
MISSFAVVCACEADGLAPALELALAAEEAPPDVQPVSMMVNTRISAKDLLMVFSIFILLTII